MGYVAVPIQRVATANQASHRISIRHRENEVVVPTTVRWMFVGTNAASGRSAVCAVSRSREHERTPPTQAEMLRGGDVFFAVSTWVMLLQTNVGITQGWHVMEARVEGIVVAGDLFACVRNDLGIVADFRCEFYYGVRTVSRIEKGMAIWRRETAESPN